MKIIYDIPGQTCNRFWSFIDLVARAILNKEKVIVLFGDKDFKDYPHLIYNSCIKMPASFPQKGFFYKLCYNRISMKFYSSAIAQKLGFVKGWDYCGNSEWYPKIKDQVLKIFQPRDEIVKDIVSFLTPFKKEGRLIIGVHIRQGDYKTWRNGIYYFTQQEYAQIMQHITTLYPQKDIMFCLCSNAKIEEEHFVNIPHISLNKTSSHDLELLSQCDRIIGPLSTFSRWASLKGEVPLYLLERGQLPNSDKDFKVIASLFRFKDGSSTPGKSFSTDE